MVSEGSHQPASPTTVTHSSTTSRTITRDRHRLCHQRTTTPVVTVNGIAPTNVSTVTHRQHDLDHVQVQVRDSEDLLDGGSGDQQGRHGQRHLHGHGDCIVTPSHELDSTVSQAHADRGTGRLHHHRADGVDHPAGRRCRRRSSPRPIPSTRASISSRASPTQQTATGGPSAARQAGALRQRDQHSGHRRGRQLLHRVPCGASPPARSTTRPARSGG